MGGELFYYGDRAFLRVIVCTDCAGDRGECAQDFGGGHDAGGWGVLYPWVGLSLSWGREEGGGEID